MKNIIFYLITLLAIAYILIMYQDPALLYLLIFGVLFFIFMAGIAAKLSDSIKLNLICPKKTADKNEQIPVEIVLINSSILPLIRCTIKVVLFNQFDNSREICCIDGSAGGKSKTTLTYTAQSGCCGCLHVQIEEIRIYDIVNLISFRRKSNESLKILVLPEIHYTECIPGISARYFYTDADTYSDTKSGDDPSQVFQIREYRPGDRLQNIHWKLSAKKNTHMVRENSLPVGYPVLVLIDLASGNTDISMMNTIIEAAVSISSSLLQHECCHYTAWYDSTLSQVVRYPVENQDSLALLIRQLITLKSPGQTEDLWHQYKQLWPESRFHAILKIDYTAILYKNDDPVMSFTADTLKDKLLNLNLTV